MRKPPKGMLCEQDVTGICKDHGNLDPKEILEVCEDSKTVELASKAIECTVRVRKQGGLWIAP